jgi:hypothetical protein
MLRQLTGEPVLEPGVRRVPEAPPSNRPWSNGEAAGGSLDRSEILLSENSPLTSPGEGGKAFAPGD